MLARRELANILVVPTGVLAVHLVMAYVVGIYRAYPSFDIPMHTAGGISIGIAAVLFIRTLQRKRKLPALPWWFVVLFAVAMTALAATLWEFFEFSADNLYALSREFGFPLPGIFGEAFEDLGRRSLSFQEGLPDTMLDMALGLAGGLLSSATTVLVKRK